MNDDLFDDSPYGNEEEDLGYLIPKCEEALGNGTIAEVRFSEEEYDYLINHYMNEDNGEVVSLLAELGYSRHPYSAEMVIRYADVLIVNKLYSKAMDVLKKRLSTDAHNPDVLFLYAKALSRTGDLENARRYVAMAAKFAGSEDAVEMYVSLGQDLMEEDKFDEALYYLKKAHSGEPDNYEILNDLAFCYDRTGDVMSSMKAYNMLIDLDPFNDYVWYNLGTMHSKMLDFDKAQEAYDYALALNPQNSSALYNKAVICVNDGSYIKAVELFEEFLSIEPDNISVMVALADAYLTLGNGEKASVCYRRALEIDKYFVEANAGMAYIEMTEKDYFGALVYLRRIAGSDETDHLFLLDRLLLSYEESQIPEYLVYALVALYKLGMNDRFYVYLDLLLAKDELWLTKLFEYLPKAGKDRNVAMKIKKYKEGLSN